MTLMAPGDMDSNGGFRTQVASLNTALSAGGALSAAGGWSIRLARIARGYESEY